MYKYKTAYIGRITAKGNFSYKPAEALAPVGKKIQEEAEGGWRFVGAYNVPVEVKVGCIGRLFGNQNSTQYNYMLVFEKEEKDA